MLTRTHALDQITSIFSRAPIAGILGPRQTGKTTLAKEFARNYYAQEIPDLHYFDLERPSHLVQLNHPELLLSSLEGLIVFDEIQLKPDLFALLRVMVDDHPSQRYLILGSASPALVKNASESLAGRIGYLELSGFTLKETQNLNQLLLRGGFPRSFLAPDDQESYRWRNDYTQTFLERDIPQLGIDIPPSQLRRFWMMLAHYHGQIFNASELARALQTSSATVRKYLDILVGTFMLRELSPWFENISKRQVKSPKFYFRDSGLLLALLQIPTHADLLSHPKLGAIWEGFALEQVIQKEEALPQECYFWATHAHAELDLLILKNGKRIGFEFKFSDAPRLSPSMKIALQDLKLDHLFVIYPGKARYPLLDKITAIGLEAFTAS